jgi:hypothetical protein
MSKGRLQEELKKRRPFDSPEQEATLSIARTADRFGICFARLFREHGLTPSQYNVLRILRGGAFRAGTGRHHSDDEWISGWSRVRHTL